MLRASGPRLGALSGFVASAGVAVLYLVSVPFATEPALAMAPVLGGTVAAAAGLDAVYVAAAIGAAGSALIALALLRQPGSARI